MLDDFQPKPRALWIAALVFCVIVIADSWFRWSTFQYQTFDLAFYVQSFWLMVHGQSNATILDVSLMGNHAEPICFLLLPLFWIWQSPMFFVVIQALLVTTMPFTGYRIARRLEFERRGALRLGLAALIAPAAGFMALHEFHAETLAAPLILLMLEARLARRAVSFWVYFLLSAACNENVALVLGWLCVVHYFLDRQKGREWQMVFNVAPGVIALLWVAVYGYWIAPSLNGGNAAYGELYGQGGIFGMMRSPSAALSALAKAVQNGNLVLGLFGPFLLLPLLRPRWIIITAPLFAQHLVSARVSEWNINYHYAAPILPLLWFGMAEACARLYWRDTLSRWVLVSCVAFQIWMGPIRSVLTTAGNSTASREHANIRSEILAAIPGDASVAAGVPYLSHLALREKVYSLHHILRGLKTLSRDLYVPPTSVDAVFVDAADPVTYEIVEAHDSMKSMEADQETLEWGPLLDNFLANGKWRSVSRNEVTLLTRGESPEEPNVLTDSATPLDESHRLVGVRVMPPDSQDACLISITYQLEAQRKVVPWLRLYLKGSDGGMYDITKGPIALGKPAGEVGTELWAVRPKSSIPAGTYRGLLLFYDSQENNLPGKARFVKRTFDLGEVVIQ